jgi:hypothetical protein
MNSVSAIPSVHKSREDWLSIAVPYAQRGWSIVPTRNKRPIGLWKPFQRQAADEVTLARLFRRDDITGVGVVLGSVSGWLAVRDFDCVRPYEAWAVAFPDDAARMPTVRTKRGFHVFGRLGQERYLELTDGELRADSKHIVVLPPSFHPDGTIYAWVIPLPDGDLPILPESLLATCKQKVKTSIPTSHSRQTQGRHIACVSWEDHLNETLPTGPGQRNRRLFDLARRLKALAPQATAEDLRDLVQEWHRRALPRIRTTEFNVTWSDFQIAWERILHPHGSLRALLEADSEPPAALSKQYCGSLLQLATLCHLLQLQAGDAPFYLGCRPAGATIGVGFKQAHRLLKQLQNDGWLRMVVRGDKQSKQASEWRFMEDNNGR